MRANRLVVRADVVTERERAREAGSSLRWKRRRSIRACARIRSSPSAAICRPDGQSDGFVRYESAHLDGVESELIIPRSGHSVQSNPLAIEEVRRILAEHADQVCRESHVACRTGG